MMSEYILYSPFLDPFQSFAKLSFENPAAELLTLKPMYDLFSFLSYPQTKGNQLCTETRKKLPHLFGFGIVIYLR
jgi:hypothetical protein